MNLAANRQADIIWVESTQVMQLHILNPAFTILHLLVSPPRGYMLPHTAHLQGYFLFLLPLKTEVTAIVPKDQAAFLM